MKCNYNNFDNIGYVSASFNEAELFPLKQEIQNIQNDFSKAESFQQGLAGHIEKEYKIVNSKAYLEKLLFPLVQLYNSVYPSYIQRTLDIFTKIGPLTVDNAWVNFQKKTEFNPFHTHSGIYSFVIWVNIPYNYDDEKEMFLSNPPKTSVFEFIYTNALGKSCFKSIPVDKSYENTCILFPSSMPHLVYPFYTSDGYRVSVSGNFSFRID